MHRSTILVPASAAQTLFNIGQTSPGSQSGLFGGVTAVKVTLAQSGSVQSISFFAGANALGNSLLLGLYSDVSGAPGSLLATSAVTPCAIGLNTLATTSHPTLSPGNYWLCEQASASIDGYYDTPAGAGAFNGSASWTGSLPATWPAGGGSGPYQFSLYATLLG